MLITYERWCIFMALYFEMRQLPWFKVKWMKAEEDFSQPGILYAILYMNCVLLMKVIVMSDSRLPKKQR